MVYVIYKPRLQGVFNKYTTRVRGQRKFTTDKPRARTYSRGSYDIYNDENINQQNHYGNKYLSLKGDVPSDET